MSQEEAERKAKDLNSHGKKESKNGELSKALSLYKEALSVEDEGHVGMTETRAITLHQIGLVYWKLNDYEESERFLRQALEIYRKVSGTESQSLAITLQLLGSCMMDQGQLDQAEDLLKSAITAYKKSNLPSTSLAPCFHELGRLYLRKETFSEAEQYFRRAFNIHQQSGRDQRTVFSAFLLARVLQHLPGRLDEAEALQREWLPISEKECNPTSWLYSLNTRDLGVTCMMKGKLNEAKQLLTRALEIIQKCEKNTPPHIPPSQWKLRLGECLLRRQEYRDAEHWLRNAIQDTLEKAPFGYKLIKDKGLDLLFECMNQIQDQMKQTISGKNAQIENLQRQLQQSERKNRQLQSKNQLLERESERSQKQLAEYGNVLSIPAGDIQETGPELGAGAFGKVVIGKWRGNSVAVKDLYQVLVKEFNLRLIQQEISVLSKVRHPNIVSICGFSQNRDRPLQIVFEAMEGSVEDVIEAASKSTHCLTTRELTDLSVGSVAGLSYLHQLQPKALLHGDIRPTNILVTSTMQAKIGDLGTCHFVDASVSYGPVSGIYLAPERRKPDGAGNHPGNTAECDVYSLGITFIEMWSGMQSSPDILGQLIATIKNEEMKMLFCQMISESPEARGSAADILGNVEEICECDEYRKCGPKRMVKGKRYGREVELTERPWT